jgi:hypothetical protein
MRSRKPAKFITAPLALASGALSPTCRMVGHERQRWVGGGGRLAIEGIDARRSTPPALREKHGSRRIVASVPILA